jgi:glycosyltransferase involved in cell wall biosynthesis
MPGRVEVVDELCAFMDQHATSPIDILAEFFHRLDRLRERQAEIPEHFFTFPGPLIRRIVHFLDGHALAPRQIRRYFAISDVVARRAGYFPPGVPIHVLPPPSHLSGFHDTAQDYLFAPGRLDGPKRIHLLVEAMRRAHTSLPLRIAGTGPEEPRLRQLAQGDERIQFLGFVSDARLVELYGGALATAFVPLEEDYGLVAIESMMSRKPVLTCTDSGGALEFVTDRETGLVVPPDADALARAMDRLAADPGATRSMGETAHARVRDVTWERTVQVLLADRAAPASRMMTAVAPFAAPPHVVRRTPRPRITLAVSFPVFPPVGGGQRRILSLYRHVASAFDVVLVTLAEAGTPPFETEIAPGLTEVRIPKSERHAAKEQEIARRCHGIPIGDIAMTLLHRHTPQYHEALARALDGAAVVVASHPYALPAIQDCSPTVPLVYEAHNVESLLKESVLSQLGPAAAELIEAVREVEAAACRAARLVLACSEEDRRALARLYRVREESLHLSPNGVDTAAVRFVPVAERRHLKAQLGLEGRPIALFVGSWHPPNLKAAAAIYAFAESMPNVTFLLVGSQCMPLATSPRPQNVGLVGIVDEDTLMHLLAVADVALNPMSAGSGTNLKMGTYLAAGLPVVTTPLGARGYELVDGEHVRVATGDGFPAAIAATLSDTGLTARLATAGRRLVEERYDWQRIAAGLVAALRRLLGRPAHGDVLEAFVDAIAADIAAVGVPVGDPIVDEAAVVVNELATDHRARSRGS